MRVLMITVLILCFSCISTVFAQWDDYPAYSEYLTMMEKFETDYPHLCKIIEIGESARGRKLLVAKVSDNVGTHEMEPGFLYHATLHGDEVLGYMLMLRLIDHLLSQYNTNTMVTTLVNNVQIYIDPLANPDGTYMAGNHTVSGARRYNANSVDLNRNFPGIPDTGVSQPQKEVAALMDFAAEYPFIMSAGLHSGVEMLLYPSTVFGNCSTACVDNAWFNHVSSEYALNAFNASDSTFILKVTPDSTLYSIFSSRWNYYALQYLHSRSICFELSMQKNIPPAQVPKHWNNNHTALLGYIEQSLFGVRGTVTDTMTGEPLNAKVFVENHDKDSSFMYSRLPHGDYYRPIYEGIYDITYSCDGYYPKSVTGISVVNGQATEKHVKLRKISTGIKTVNGLQLTVTGYKTVEIYDLLGKKVKTLPANADFHKWKAGNGIYIVRFTSEGVVNKTLMYVK